MTSERPRFPIGLTLAAVVVFGVCVGLGVWQLQRAAWRAQLMERIAAAHQGAAPIPLGHILVEDQGSWAYMFQRVVVDCAPGSMSAGYRMTADQGEWVARARAACRLPPGGRYDGVLVDRGIFTASRGTTAPPTVVLPPPEHVVGVLISHTGGFPDTLARPAPFVLVAEQETPAAPGVQPTPYANAADNLQYVGSYAPTWFGLAGVLACFYAAMLWRRRHPRR